MRIKIPGKPREISEEHSGWEEVTPCFSGRKNSKIFNQAKKFLNLMYYVSLSFRNEINTPPFF